SAQIREILINESAWEEMTCLFALSLTVIGVLPRVAGVSTPAGMPIIISGFMQGSWKIAAFQFIGLFARFAGWYFFFKTADLVACREENQTDTI
ncbi:hypothetical protein ACOW01_19520, partial [Klebsiella pneumoniae]